ncbi:39S ribosomal protein L46, mitochondrial [Rhizopus stolonifer]|uniref:39S ribosomal protein L46, mitochondrial n=1 Tax=Rhizopus stolonifer TaxID=4846 RepID=A0A367KTT8_RHIST|nr:39S ribosomal protein L46, mitochondrial [Rhizopus stolonifer]
MSTTEIYRAVSAIVLRRLPNTSTLRLPNSKEPLHNIARKPNELLYLLVKKPRKHHAWQFPQGGQEEGESASEGALRELKEECGTELKVRLLDTKQPVGTYQYMFPKSFVENQKRVSIGARVRHIKVFSSVAKTNETRFLSLELTGLQDNVNQTMRKS